MRTPGELSTSHVSSVTSKTTRISFWGTGPRLTTSVIPRHFPVGGPHELAFLGLLERWARKRLVREPIAQYELYFRGNIPRPSSSRNTAKTRQEPPPSASSSSPPQGTQRHDDEVPRASVLANNRSHPPESTEERRGSVFNLHAAPPARLTSGADRVLPAAGSTIGLPSRGPSGGGWRSRSPEFGRPPGRDGHCGGRGSRPVRGARPPRPGEPAATSARFLGQRIVGQEVERGGPATSPAGRRSPDPDATSLFRIREIFGVTDARLLGQPLLVPTAFPASACRSFSEYRMPGLYDAVPE